MSGNNLNSTSNEFLVKGRFLKGIFGKDLHVNTDGSHFYAVCNASYHNIFGNFKRRF